jgi:hypothetical protein
MANNVMVTANKVYHRHKIGKITTVTLTLLLLFLIIVYVLLSIVYSTGNFTVSLDSEETLKSGISIYESLNDPKGKNKLYAKSLTFMDNISGKWIPENIDSESDGAHNGDNYIAYTFYVENQGDETLNYWYKVVVDDVIKNVDKAARIMIIQNGNKVVYAKTNELSGEAEEGTIPFTTYDDGTIIIQERQNFAPGDLDKYTVVIWIEGDDPDCVDALIGGEIKMHMDITEEHIE